MYRIYFRILLLALLTFSAMILASERTAIAAENVIRLAPLKAGRTRPLVAIIADNRGTETTDLIIPYGVIRSAEASHPEDK